MERRSFLCGSDDLDGASCSAKEGSSWATRGGAMSSGSGSGCGVRSGGAGRIDAGAGLARRQWGGRIRLLGREVLQEARVERAELADAGQERLVLVLVGRLDRLQLGGQRLSLVLSVSVEKVWRSRRELEGLDRCHRLVLFLERREDRRELLLGLGVEGILVERLTEVEEVLVGIEPDDVFAFVEVGSVSHGSTPRPSARDLSARARHARTCPVAPTPSRVGRDGTHLGTPSQCLRLASWATRNVCGTTPGGSGVMRPFGRIPKTLDPPRGGCGPFFPTPGAGGGGGSSGCRRAAACCRGWCG